MLVLLFNYKIRAFNQVSKRLFGCICLVVVLWSHFLNAQANVQLETLKIQGVEGAVAQNVSGFLQPFLKRRFSAADHAIARKDVESALQAFGYYNSKIALTLTDHQQTLQVDIAAQERLKWNAIDIEVLMHSEADPFIDELVLNVPIKLNEPVRHDLYQKTKVQLESALLARGYFDFRWIDSQLRVNKKRQQASVVLRIEAGVRYRFGGIVMNTDVKTKTYIRHLAPFQHNAFYQAEQLSEFNLSLNATPYFSAIKVYPLLKERENGQVPIRVDVYEKPANSYEVGGGYSTDLGARGRFKWSKPWVSEQGHFIESNLSLSEQQQDITASYTIPVSNPNDDVWRVLGGYQIQDQVTDNVETKIWNIQLQRQWLTDDDWVRTAFIKREHQTTQRGVNVDNLPQVKTEMLLPGVSYAKKNSKGGALPYWGNEQLFSVEVASKELISSASLVKVNWKHAWLRSYKARHLFFARVDLGAIIADEIKAVPFNMRFFAGGDQSIRGFAYQSVAPRDEQGELLGGKYMVTSAAEYNYQFLPNWRAAVFIDAGAVDNEALSDWSVGGGFGIRYITPIGPIRLDHAWGLSKASKSTRLSIVIGPEI